MKHSIRQFPGGFEETYPLGAVERAIFRSEASATVFFRDGREEINLRFRSPGKTRLPYGPGPYQAQFGIPFSPDGKLMFYYTWENGVEAISLETGKAVWRVHARHAGRISVYESYLIVIQQGIAVLKVDLATGQLLARIGCDVHRRFDLTGPYQLIDSIRGRVSVLDTRDMSVRKKYPAERINPKHLPTCIIREAELTGTVLTISGFENGPFPVDAEPAYFSRVIDDRFFEGL